MNWLNNLWNGVSSFFGGSGGSQGVSPQLSRSTLMNPATSLSARATNPQGLSFASRTAAQPNFSLMGQFNPSTQATKAASSYNPMAGMSFNAARNPSMQAPANFYSGGLSGMGASNKSMQAPPSAVNITSPDVQEGKPKNKFLEMFNPSTQGGQIGIGLASELAGQVFGPKSPKLPDFSSLPSYQRMNTLSQQRPTGMDPNLEAAINRNLDQQFEGEMRNLRNIYKNARPGTDYTTDSAYQRDLAQLQNKQALSRADAMANATNESIQTQLMATDQEMQQLSQLAEMDISQIMLQLGMDSEEANQFKQTFSNIGSMFLQKGLGFDQFQAGV